MIVAMAARLAEHLKARLSKSVSDQLRAEPQPSAHAAAEPMRMQFLQSAFAEGSLAENVVVADDAGTHVVEPGTIVAVTGATASRRRVD